MDDQALGERITNLEIKLTYQDDLINTLDEVVIELRGELERMNKKLLALEQHVQRPDEDSPPQDERPPHY